MLRIELLDATHDRAGFDCGTDALNRYLKETARQHVVKGGIGLFVDAKDEEAARFYRRFGFEPTPGQRLVLFLPMHTIQQLAGGEA